MHDHQMPGAAAVGQVRTETSAEIIEAVARSRRRDQTRFRTIFAATWGVLLGAILIGLLAANKIDPVFLGRWQEFILAGIPITILVSASSIAVAIVFAVIGALGRLSDRPVIYALASFYVSLVRGTPLIVQILFIYLALPQIWDGFAGIPTLVLGVFALAFNYGAYMTEVFRAGIQAIPRGQLEAAAALGMTDRMTMRRVILPQAIRIVTPAIGNEFIAMIKDSALVSLLGVQELLWRAQRVGTQNFRALEALLVAALVYWVLTIVFSLLQDRLEKRMAESDRRV
ncbi:MAG: amino acid ABC transporter permease [Chloroflexota bacterium]|jgi:polar amino acid transport system permease protein|nr:amino acid ABC transporter permease [Chloroflexota bacterium]MDH5243142.1 amino acid ABC transporter permease [Chloroflexota bacterium]